MPDFGWSYPPGVSSVPDDDVEDEWVCQVCNLAVQKPNYYCGPSCEQMAEESRDDLPFSVDWGWWDWVDDPPFVLVTTTHNPFHIPTSEELTKEDPNAS